MRNKEMMFVAQEAAENANTKGANYFGDEGELNNYLFENVMCLTTSSYNRSVIKKLLLVYIITQNRSLVKLYFCFTGYFAYNLQLQL